MKRWLTLLLPALAAAEDLPRQAMEVLQANCVPCHGSALQLSKLDLRTAESMKKGGERGAAMVPGDSAASRIFRMAAHIDQPSMPPGKKLAEWQLNVIKRWIDTGAPMPEKMPDQDARASLKALEDRPVTEEERRWWSFQPLAKPPVPAASAKNPIDAFLAAAWRGKGLEPAPPANRRALIRRAYLDLTGLPPHPDDVAAFIADTRPDAWERLVDKLLASPQYGERWARHWLDLVRYADSGGYEFDRDRRNSWRYRDYVIRSFNSNKPLDRFIREQLAGDEIAPADQDALIATGYLRLGPEANIKTELTRMDELDDILSTTAQTFLGMTVGCARCHNHKFDPIPQKDYYRMQAVFFPTKPVEYPLVDAAEMAKFKAENKRIDELLKPVKQEKDDLEKPYRQRLEDEKKAALPAYVQEALRTPPEKRTEGQRLNATQVEKTLRVDEKEILAILSPADAKKHQELVARMKAIEKMRPEPLPAAMGIGEENAQPDPSYFLHRGSPDSKGTQMSPGVLTVAARSEPAFDAVPANAKSSYRRKVFADWLVSPDNPLTPRVMVNRIWQHHFGEGLVRTPSNFGKTGEKPTHPELLDWLAGEFLRTGWDVKQMHRLMMTSNAYRMASDDIEANRKIDPDNRMLWRMPRRRLDAESIRDSVLAVAGTLRPEMGGPGIQPWIDPSLFQASSGRDWKGKPDDDPETWRRSIYVFSKRTIPLPMLEVFDRPDSIGSCARRNRSTTAPQALILMNNSFMQIQAGAFAKRVRNDAGNDARAQVDRAYELALARPPSPTERALAMKFLSNGPDALADLCHALMNINEFVYAP